MELRLELYHDNSVCLEGSEAAEMIWIHEDVSQGFKKEVDDFGVITRAKDRQRPTEACFVGGYPTSVGLITEIHSTLHANSSKTSTFFL